MGVLKTFKTGGVHPPENKLSEHQPIEVLPLPENVSIPLSQHLGVPSVPVVNKGDKVKTGQIVARGEAFISANIHSSVTGTVTKIDDVVDVSGYRKKTLIIKVEEDQWEESVDTTGTLIKDCGLTPEEIVKKVNRMGIVGMGGAAFPTHVKLTVPKGKKADYLIINGAECEPYLTSDHRLMIEKGKELMVGITIKMKALGVNKAIIGIEKNKPDAIEYLDELAEEYKGISVEPLKVKYPQGGEKQLIKALVNREVPSGKLPIEVGCIVHNVGTTYAVYEAVQKNKPLIERIVTVTGIGVERPCNLLVRIGTPVSALIEAAGGIPKDTGKVVSGGPMMGKALINLEVPVTKGTSGILVFPEATSQRITQLNCIRCAKCVSTCPMTLEPYLLGLLSDKKRYEHCEKNQIMDCVECGSCQYVCPSGRPLLDQIRVGKAKVGQMIRERSAK